MTYRDDRDALLHRNDALERENERLHRQLAELKDAAKAGEPARPSLVTRAVRALGRGVHAIGKWIGRLAASVVRKRRNAALVVVSIAGVAVWLAASRLGIRLRHGTPSERVTIERVMIGASDGAIVSVLARRHGRRTDRFELASYDIRSGKRTGALELSSSSEFTSRSYSLFRPVGNRIWGRAPDGRIALLDLAGPSLALSSDAVVAAVPELAAGYEVIHATIDDYSPPTPAVKVKLHDGRTGWVDMTPAFLTSPPPNAPWPPGYFCGPDHGAKPSCERTQCIAFASLPGTTAMALSSVPTWPDGQRHRAVPIAAEATPLLRPGLVERLETECAFELEASVLVVHDSAALEPKQTLISLLDANGRARWSVPLAELTDRAKSKPLGAVVVGDEIVLLLHENRRTLDLIRLSSAGGLLARHRLL